jgi:hypothetical protein
VVPVGRAGVWAYRRIGVWRPIGDETLCNILEEHARQVQRMSQALVYLFLS